MVIQGDGSANKPFEFLSEDEEIDNQKTEEEDEEMNFGFAGQQATGNSNINAIDLTKSTDDDTSEEMEEETDKEYCMSIKPPQEFWNAQLHFHQATSTQELPFGGYFLRQAWHDLFEAEDLSSNFMARVTSFAKKYVNAYIYNCRQESASQQNQLALEQQHPTSTVAAAACHNEADTSESNEQKHESDDDSTIAPPLIPRNSCKRDSDKSEDDGESYQTEESSDHINTGDELNKFTEESEDEEKVEEESSWSIYHVVSTPAQRKE